jgi:hypothetical protein
LNARVKCPSFLFLPFFLSLGFNDRSLESSFFVC